MRDLTWILRLRPAGFMSSFSFADVYHQAFCQLRVDGDLLRHLTEDDLRDDLGMRSSIHRKAVLRAIGALEGEAPSEAVSATVRRRQWKGGRGRGE